MNTFCLGWGLVISPRTRSECVVSDGPGTASTWWVGSQVLPQSARFLQQYLGLNFQESNSLSYSVQRLTQNAVGTCAQCRDAHQRLLHEKVFHMMRRLFDALVLPWCHTISEIGGPCGAFLRLGNPPDMAAGLVRLYSCFGMASQISSSGISGLNSL